MTTTIERQCKDPVFHVTTSTYRDKYLANLVSGNHHLLMSALLMCYGYYVAGLSHYTSIERYKYWCMCFVALTMPLAHLCRTWIHKSSYDPFHKPHQRGYPRTDVQYLNALTATSPRANTFWKELGLTIHSIMMSDSCKYYTCGISQNPVRPHSDGPSDMLSGEFFVDSSSANARHRNLAGYRDLCYDSYFVVGPDDGCFKIPHCQILFGKTISKTFLARLEASSSLHLISFLRDWGPSLQANLRFNKLPKNWALEMSFGVQARFTRRTTFWRPGTKTLALRWALDPSDSKISEYDQSHLQEPLSNEMTCSVISNRQGRVAHSALGPVSPRRLQMSASLNERRQCNYTSILGGLFIPPLILGIMGITIGVCLAQPEFLTKALALLSSSDPNFTHLLDGDATRIQKSRNKTGRVSVCTAVYPDLHISFGASSPYGDNTEAEFLKYHGHLDPPPSSLGVSQTFLVKFMHNNYVATSTAASATFCTYFESFVAYVHNADIITLIPDFHPEPPLKSICPFGAPFPNVQHQSYVATSTVAHPTHSDYHNLPSTIRPIHGTTILHQEECIELLFGLSYPYEGCDLETTSRKYVAARTVASSTLHNYADPSAVFRTVSETTFLQQHNCSSFLPGSFRDSRRSKSKFKHTLEHAPEPKPNPPPPDGGGPINCSARPSKPRPAPRPSPPTPDGGGPNNISLGITTLFEVLSKAITV
jgi:hypothetical protein